MTDVAGAFELPPGTIVADKYRIERELGRGGMGRIYRAHHLALDHAVAIKVLTGDLPEEVARFRREARAAAKLEGEHVARVLDSGEAEGVGPYIVMELLEGADLGAILRAQGPLPVPAAVDAILEAIDALAEAHALGIVHRDVKPSNLFVARRPDRGVTLKVLDFGISKVSRFGEDALPLTDTSTLIGSPHYMSPEQLMSARDVDARADIWSLGVVLYELLTGQRPFAAGSLGAVFARVLEATIVAPRALRADVPREVEEAILRCLERAPADRYPDVRALARALVPFGSGRSNSSLVRATSVPPSAMHPPSLEMLVGATRHTSAAPRSSKTPAPQSASIAQRPSRRRSAWAARARLVSVFFVVLAVSVAWVSTRRVARTGRAIPSASGPPVEAIASEPPPPPDPAAVSAVALPRSGSSMPVPSTSVPPPFHPRVHTAAPPSIPPSSTAAPDLDRRR